MESRKGEIMYEFAMDSFVAEFNPRKEIERAVRKDFKLDHTLVQDNFGPYSDKLNSNLPT